MDTRHGQVTDKRREASVTPLPCPRCAPDAWRVTVRAAIVRAGSLRGAAAALGVSAREVGRWLARDPSIADGLVLRAPGRPRAVARRG